MRVAACLLVAFACSGAFASEPGQPLGCEDWIAVAPGLSIEADQLHGFASGPVATDRVAFDNEGNRMIMPSGLAATPTGPCGVDQLPILRATPSGGFELLACLGARRNPGTGTDDSAQPWNEGCFLTPATVSGACVRFNPITGDLFFNYLRVGAGYPNSPNWCVLHGLTTLYDVLQSFTPQPALGFRVPYMPEGMPGADHFDTYWGPLAKPLDFTQAHPLACDYPATAPHVGDYLTVADTVPTPEPGAGVYYVTSATYQGATRYGRKTIAGHTTGRDPALLPACVAP